MGKEKHVQIAQLLSHDKIKKEPEESGNTTPASKPSPVSKTITVLTSPPNSSTKTSCGQPKTILLVQTVSSRTGGIQSLLLPQSLLPSTTSDQSQLASRGKISTMLTVTSSALKSSTAPKMAECFLTTATSSTTKPVALHAPQGVQPSQGVQPALPSTTSSEAQVEMNSVAKILSSEQSSPLQRICKLTFKSRTIKADGTVSSLKEYLCNFCQFMVASQDEFREHFMTHIFSCDHCNFRAFTRFEVLNHKKKKHPGIAEELAGYEGLDSFSDQLNSVIADLKLTEIPKASSPSLPAFSIQVPVVNSPLSSIISTQQSIATTETVGSNSSPVLILSPKPSIQTIRTYPLTTPVSVISSSCNFSGASRLHSVSTLASATAISTSAVSSAPVTSSQKTPPIFVTSAVSTPSVLPMSAVKTTAGVGKSNDNYFTYKVVHDAAGKVQAYECDVCSYRSAKVNEIFSHASTHSLKDLMKPNSSNVKWECFYCPFISGLQANVVSHVIAKHPNKPVQLKRMVSNTQRPPRSILSPNLMLDVTMPPPAKKKTSSSSIKKEKNADETLTASSTTAMTAKKNADAEDGCMWGCYYCSAQSVDRNEIILHLKKDHAQQKLVITRRRITHIPMPQSSKGDDRLETAETGGNPAQNDSEMIFIDKTNSDVQIGDIDSTDPQHSLLKSRRKQVLPRKLPDDIKTDEAGDSGKAAKSSESMLPINKGKRRFQNVPKSKESVDLVELKTLEVRGGRKSRRSGEINVEGSSKRRKLNREIGKSVDLTSDLEDDAMKVRDGQEGVDVSMPALEDLSNLTKLKTMTRKCPADAVASTETRVASDSGVTGFAVNEMVVENDKEMPIVHPELGVPQQLLEGKPGKGPETSSAGNSEQPFVGAGKGVNFPDDFIVNDAQLFRYSSVTSEASCKQCTATVRGSNARNHMREHCVSHTGGQLWKCPYCPFKCGRCSLVVRHVRSRHKNRPLNAIQRKTYPRSSENSLQDAQGKTEQFDSLAKSKRPTAMSKLRGPRSVKENHIILSGSHLWECPFCGRRSLFKGSIKVHVKVAHPNEDNEAKLKYLPRPGLAVNSLTASQKVRIDIIPIESMHLYDSLGTLLLDNGVSLKYDLDIDDDVDDNDVVMERTGLRYQCVHCNFRNLTPQIMKIHILEIHPGESTAVLDNRSSSKTNQLFLCNNIDCCFASSKPEALTMHQCKMAEMEKPEMGETEKPVAPPPVDGETPVSGAQEIHGMESRLSSDILSRLRTQGNSDGDVGISGPHLNAVKSLDNTLSGEGRHESSHLSINSRRRIKTPEGPIEYNDDGTLKGVDLENGSMNLQCPYCDYPSTSDPVEIKLHLAAKHPRLQAIAVDVDVKEKAGLAYLFICSVFGCDYSSRYSNVFEHHMNVEHPDVESVRLVKKKRTLKRNSAEKFRTQTEVPRLEQNESLAEQAIVEENPGPNRSRLSEDCANREPIATIASPTASSFPQSAPSPAGTVGSDASNAVVDSPAIVSPDDVKVSVSPFPTKDASRHGRKPRMKNQIFNFPCRYECVQCSFRVGTPEEMKNHLVVKHHENLHNFYCIDRRARELRKRQKIIFCHDPRCGFYCKFNEELENHGKYDCHFAPAVRHRHQKETQERVVQYMDSVIKMNPEGEKRYQVGAGSRTAMLDDVNNKIYQCSHCTFITTDLHSIRMHVIAEHAATEGGFAEIKTELGTDGNIVMNVNDRGVDELDKSAAANLVCDKNIVRETRSMYDAVDTVKVDDEEKVYTVL